MPKYCGKCGQPIESCLCRSTYSESSMKFTRYCGKCGKSMDECACTKHESRSAMHGFDEKKSEMSQWAREFIAAHSYTNRLSVVCLMLGIICIVCSIIGFAALANFASEFGASPFEISGRDIQEMLSFANMFGAASSSQQLGAFFASRYVSFLVWGILLIAVYIILRIYTKKPTDKRVSL